MSKVKLNLAKIMADQSTKGSMNLSVKTVSNGIIINASSNIHNNVDPKQNENANEEYVYKGTPVQIKKDIDADLGIGNFFLDGTEK